MEAKGVFVCVCRSVSLTADGWWHPSVGDATVGMSLNNRWTRKLSSWQLKAKRQRAAPGCYGMSHTLCHFSLTPRCHPRAARTWAETSWPC